MEVVGHTLVEPLEMAELAAVATEESRQTLMLAEAPELPILVAEVEVELYLLQPKVRLLAVQAAQALLLSNTQ